MHVHVREAGAGFGLGGEWSPAGGAYQRAGFLAVARHWSTCGTAWAAELCGSDGASDSGRIPAGRLLFHCRFRRSNVDHSYLA